MKVTIRYFAVLREVVGTGEEVREVPDGATVGELFDAVAAEEPRLRTIKAATMLMVNQNYVPASHPLVDGDEVAFIPPVSGGELGRFRVVSEAIDPRAVEALVEHPGAGAVVTFTGRVRDNARDRTVVDLEYEAYPAAAERMLAQIGDEIAARWEIDSVAIVHRSGLLAVGEASVVIAVASPHRDVAYAASRYAIERIKEIVPIWKKERYEDGAAWIGSEAAYQAEIGRTAATSA